MAYRCGKLDALTPQRNLEIRKKKQEERAFQSQSQGHVKNGLPVWQVGCFNTTKKLGNKEKKKQAERAFQSQGHVKNGLPVWQLCCFNTTKKLGKENKQEGRDFQIISKSINSLSLWQV